MDDALYLYWTRIICLASLPALLAVSVVILRRMRRETGRIPAYWGAVHAAGLGVYLVAGLTHGSRVRTSILVVAIIGALAWAAAIKLSLDWWKARRARPEPPR